MDFLFSKDFFFYNENIGHNNWDYLKGSHVNNLCLFLFYEFPQSQGFLII